MIALLVNEPWCLPLSEVRKLTPAAILAFYFRERDEMGRLKIEAQEEAAPLSARQRVEIYALYQKIPHWRIPALQEARRAKIAQQAGGKPSAG